MEGTEIKLLRVATTRPEPGPDLGFGTRYPTRPEFCLLVPPLATIHYNTISLHLNISIFDCAFAQ